jgi:hypothetical protein
MSVKRMVAVERDVPPIVLDSDGVVVVQWSRQAEELLRRAAAEVVGRPARHLVTRTAGKSSRGAESSAIPLRQDHLGRTTTDHPGSPGEPDTTASTAFCVSRMPSVATGLGTHCAASCLHRGVGGRCRERPWSPEWICRHAVRSQPWFRSLRNSLPVQAQKTENGRTQYGRAENRGTDDYV